MLARRATHQRRVRRSICASSTASAPTGQSATSRPGARPAAYSSAWAARRPDSCPNWPSTWPTSRAGSWRRARSRASAAAPGRSRPRSGATTSRRSSTEWPKASSASRLAGFGFGGALALAVAAQRRSRARRGHLRRARASRAWGGSPEEIHRAVQVAGVVGDEHELLEPASTLSKDLLAIDPMGADREDPAAATAHRTRHRRPRGARFGRPRPRGGG